MIRIGLFLLFLSAISVFAQENEIPTKTMPQTAAISGDQKDVIVIDPKERSQDFAEAYEIIKKGKSPQSIIFHLSDGRALTNVTEMSAMKNGTLILFKIATNMGVKIELVPIESLLSISQL